MPGHVLASQIVIQLPADRLGKAKEELPKRLGPCTHLETWKQLLASGFQLIQVQVFFKVKKKKGGRKIPS